MDIGKLLGGIDADKLQSVVKLAKDLPAFFEKISDGLSAAGEQARAASVALVGDDGDSGVRGTLGDSSEALKEIVASLTKGVGLIGDAAESAAKVPLMDGPAKRFAEAASELGDTTGKLGDLAAGMASIADTLTAVGKALASLGDHLDDTGSQARGFVSA